MPVSVFRCSRNLRRARPPTPSGPSCCFGLLQDAGVTAIYTSDRKRTQQTAEPLAKALGITPTTVAAQGRLVEATLSLIREREKSAIVVIVSHGDTVPGFLKALGHPGQITIGPREHDDIFVTVPASGGPPTVVRLNY